MTQVVTPGPVTTSRGSLARAKISFAGSAISAAMGLVLIVVLGRARRCRKRRRAQAIAAFTSPSARPTGNGLGRAWRSRACRTAARVRQTDLPVPAGGLAAGGVLGASGR